MTSPVSSSWLIRTESSTRPGCWRRRTCSPARTRSPRRKTGSQGRPPKWERKCRQVADLCVPMSSICHNNSNDGNVLIASWSARIQNPGNKCYYIFQPNQWISEWRGWGFLFNYRIMRKLTYFLVCVCTNTGGDARAERWLFSQLSGAEELHLRALLRSVPQ